MGTPWSGCPEPNIEDYSFARRMSSGEEAYVHDFWPFEGVAWASTFEYIRSVHCMRRDGFQVEDHLYGNGAFSKVFAYSSIGLLMDINQQQVAQKSR